MELSPLPTTASWTLDGSRPGLEVVSFEEQGGGRRFTGHTDSLAGSVAWSVGYDVTLDDTWATRSATATSRGADGTHSTSLVCRPGGNWRVDGEPRPDLEGCVDVDLESSAVTNTLPIHRLHFSLGVRVDVPAAFIRTEDLGVERLEQSYTLVRETSAGPVFHYESTTFDFRCELRLDLAGLVVDYPGIATRHS